MGNIWTIYHCDNEIWIDSLMLIKSFGLFGRQQRWGNIFKACNCLGVNYALEYRFKFCSFAKKAQVVEKFSVINRSHFFGYGSSSGVSVGTIVIFC